MLRKQIGVIAIMGAALLTFAVYTDKFQFTPARTSSPSQKDNVILIQVDSLRADHVGIYGYNRNTTPNIDNFAKENILFTQAISQGTRSLTSHASFFTSQYPQVHGAGMDRALKGLNPLDPSALTMAEVFKEQGYKTAAFVGERHLEPQYGLHQGFEVYNSKGLSFNDSIPPAVKWLEENKNEKFFLFLQGYDLHIPYEAPEPFWHMFDPEYEGILHDLPFHDPYYETNPTPLIKKDGNPVIEIEDKVTPLTQRDIDHLIAHYDEEVLYADYKVGQFLDTLSEMGLYDNSIIVLFADHGETVGDNVYRPSEPNPKGHSANINGHTTLTEEVIHVPLIIKSRIVESKTIFVQAQLIDIFPTLLDLLDITPNQDLKKRLQGQSLVPAIKGNADRDFNTYTYGNRPIRKFIRTPRWKLLATPLAIRLYDLKNDPGETQNVQDQYPEVFEQLQEKLTEWSFANLKKKLELESIN